MQFKSLTEIKPRPVGDVLKGLLSDSQHESSETGLRLVQSAAAYGLDIKDYLILAVKPEADLDGFEMCLAALNLPFKNDFKNGIVLQAASDTFQTYPGTRAMFPPVIDQMLQWAVRQDQYEVTSAIVGGSRTMNGIELITAVVNDDTLARDTFLVGELSNIPIQSIRTTELSVKMYKHGSGIRTSYEFQRRVALDVLTPYAARVARQLEISKVAQATNVIINGDGVHVPAPVVTQSSFNGLVAGAPNATAGQISWQHMLRWLVSRAQAMTPVDTVVGNWDAAFNWAALWQVPLANASGVSAGENIARVGEAYGFINIPIPKFAISSTAPENKLIGITKAETVEELVEGGSQITESDRAIRNQSITYVKSEVTGYRLVYGDTRSIFDFGN